MRGGERSAGFNRAAITVSIMLATIMQGVDNTIANVALPHIQGALSASQDQAAWVLTSNIVAAAIMMPLTGWLAGHFGIKYVFLISVAGRPARTCRTGAEVAAQLQSRIDRGNELQARPIQSRDDADLYKSDLRKWREYNFALLQQIFTNETIAIEYRRAGLVTRAGDNEEAEFEILRETTNHEITKLESIVERLELYPEQGSVQAVAAEVAPAPDLSKVFIVHGHDRASKAEVGGFIQKLGFEAIILHERPNKGRALITKFREEAAGAGFAVVLMTPDDLVD